MAGKPQKAVILGLDAPIASRVYKYAKRGQLPTIKKLIEKGVYAENYLVQYPTVTPQNWTTIATGANIGTHGITGFQVHLSGEDLNKVHSAFNTSLCEAEYLWDAAERAGRKSIIINWPCIYPATLKNGYQLGGTGLAMNEWRVERRGLLYIADLSDGQLFTTEDLPFATKITLKKASGWTGIDSSAQGLEAELKLKYTVCMKRGEAGEKVSKVRSPERWFMLIQKTGDGYNKVLVSKSKNADEAFAELTPGEWSDTIIDEFQTDDGPKKGAFKCKLLNLSKDGRKVSLLVTPICNLEGYSYPKSLFAEVSKVNPLALPSHIFFDGFGWGWYDEKTFIELVDMEQQYFADSATYLMKNKEWTLLMMHMHAPDWMYHYAIPPRKWDPSSVEYEGPEKAKYYEKIELEVYKCIDKAIGRIVEAAGEDALVIIVSDHGARTRGHNFSPIKPLVEAGLLSLKQTSKGWSIDLSKSKAIPQGRWVYVNLKGKYSHGIIDPSEYEEVQEKIIEALYNYVDPETNMKPVYLALKKKDARLLGLYGDRIGDVVYALRDDYGGNHGQLPTSEYGVGSLRGLLIMAGPGVKEGFRLKRTVRATDIVPTVCHLLGIPVPKNAEGGIIYQALQDLQARGDEHKITKPREKPEISEEQTIEIFQVES